MGHQRHELIIFDCDGVLIDSEAVSSRIEVQELRKLGCAITQDEYLKLSVGRTEEEEIWESVACRYRVQLPENFVDHMRGLVAEAFEIGLKPIKGVREVLDSISVRKCVASGSRPERLRRVIELSGLQQYFGGHLFSATQVPRGKPHPDLFLFAARMMNVSPSRCLVIEDSPAGASGARSAGMQVIGFVGASHCGPDWTRDLEESGVEYIVKEMQQLPEIIKSLNQT